MELFRADLHIHSRFSRATSKKLNLRLLAAWARIKGLDVLATGDFTHPEWMAEIEEHLEPDGSGLFRLRDGRHLEREVPLLDGYPLGGEPRFMLVTEISSIYKRHGKTRKNHNLVFMPDLEMAKSFNKRLAEVGNLSSDGRPILGLDSRDLLEMVLETGPQAFVVPAHVWTPWFSLFGSKSGFDSVEECFGDLAGEIFAMETGLSSDPEMNWLWSSLDRYRMISNSDAHSGEKLAREANLFSGEMSYEGIYRALRGEALGHKFLGTIEFFPEEGKYHLDGHRNCNVVMEPEETLERGGVCPVCGKPVTVGVLNRVMELADREEPERPAGAPGFTSLVPLAEVLSEVLGVGPGTKKVGSFYGRLIARFGSELAVLQDVPEEDLAKVSAPLAEGIKRMRLGDVVRNPGFDGQYGTVTVFSPQERAELKNGASLITLPGTREPLAKPVRRSMKKASTEPQEAEPGVVYNASQRRAVDAGPGPVLVVAGPGTGKTQTLMGRIRRLLEEGETPRHILALTFTRRAAGELSRRLVALRGEKQALPRADTLHALAFDCWMQSYGEAPTVMDEPASKRVFQEASGLTGSALKHAWDELALLREKMQEPQGELAEHVHAYSKVKESWNLVDYTDLLAFWLEQVEAGIWANPYTQILVDEVQDLSPLQLKLVMELSCIGGKGLFAIGDPDQSIYGFRGAVGDVNRVLRERWPHLEVITLEDNYRSSQKVLDIAAPLAVHSPRLTAHRSIPGDIRLFAAPSASAEASWIGDRIRELLGGTSHALSDSGQEGQLSPGDIAILVRFKALIPPLRKRLERLGLPCSAPETEAFWTEPRVAAILGAIGRMLGIADVAEHESGIEPVEISEQAILRGPAAVSAYIGDSRPFDRMFWEGPEFGKLKKAYEEHHGWGGLLNWVHLQSELDMVRARAEKVQIMTLHASKGLEFEAVFMPAVEDGILPMAGMGFLTGKDALAFDAGQADEERRLMYVGLTRSKGRLFVSHAGTRMLYGRELKLGPSRLLDVLPQDSFARTELVGRTVRQEKQLGLLGD